jgi:ABC-type cobalamin/Fe3+-siderophores transport system ATPase subunit
VALLSIEGVSKEYRARGKTILALDAIDLIVHQGEFVTIVGPSGCGKSTLLNLIVGLLRSSSGRILFRGDPIDGICTKIGYGPTWLAALENRKVDVALTAPPVPETAISRGFAVMLINNAKGEDPSIPEFLMEDLVARPDTLAKDADLVRRMVRALTRANRWALQSTPEQIADALKPSMTTIAPDLMLSGVKSVLPALSNDGRISERSLQITQDVLEQAGILKKRIPYSEIVNADFLMK